MPVTGSPRPIAEVQSDVLCCQKADVRHLRANHPGTDARLVCLTGRGMPDDRRLCLEAGFDEFVTKPLEPAALAGMLSVAKARL